MKKFCSKCGTPLKPGALFCQNCGEKITNDETKRSEVVKPIMKQEPQVKRTEIHHISDKKNSSKKRIVIIGAALALFIIVCGGWALYQTGKNSNSSGVIGGSGKLTTTEIKKISTKQLAAWAILYADKKYGKKWGEAADELRSGHLTIKSYPSYRFGDYEISATDGSTLYAINDEWVILFLKTRKR